jgi:hypothetical protein
LRWDFLLLPARTSWDGRFSYRHHLFSGPSCLKLWRLLYSVCLICIWCTYRLFKSFVPSMVNRSG